MEPAGPDPDGPRAGVGAAAAPVTRPAARATPVPRGLFSRAVPSRAQRRHPDVPRQRPDVPRQRLSDKILR